MILGIVAGTLSILATHLVLAALLAGVGLLIRRGFGLTGVTIRDLLVAFWVGVAAAVLLLLVWTFVWPVTAVPLVIVGLAGVAGLARSRRELGGLIAREQWSRAGWVLALLVLSSLWIANKARAPLSNTDSSLYHLQGLLWAQEYATVPGLANLFGGLAFNNASLLFAAMLDVGPWDGRAHHIANGLLTQVLLWHGLLGIARVVRSTGADRVQGFFEAMLVAPAANLAMEDRLTSYVTDVPMAAFVLVAAAQLHLLLLRPDDDPRESAWRGFTILTLLAAAVTFKVPAAPLAVACAVLVTAWLLLRVRPGPSLRKTAALWSFGAVGGLAAAWLARGALLSGYLLFPSSRFPLPVEWRAPEALARGEFAFAAHSSFATVERPAAVMGQMSFVEWLPGWWSISGSSDLHYLAVPAVILFVCAIAWVLLRGARRTALATLWVAVPAAIAAAVWFVVAPEPRYGAPFLWIMACVAATALFQAAAGARASTRAVAVALLLLGVSPLVVSPLHGPLDRRLDPVRRIVKQNLLLPGPAAWLHPTTERPVLSQYTTQSGLVLNVPDGGHCWDAPLPCTRNPAPNLRLRVAGDLGRGFVVDGPWAMEDWPAPQRKRFRNAWAEHERRHVDAARPWNRIFD